MPTASHVAVGENIILHRQTNVTFGIPAANVRENIPLYAILDGLFEQLVLKMMFSGHFGFGPPNEKGRNFSEALKDKFFSTEP